MVLSKLYTGKPSIATELQPESAGGATVPAGALCYSLLKSLVHKFSKNLKEISKFYYHKCNMKQTPHSGKTL
jgi:hypothetical protein